MGELAPRYLGNDSIITDRRSVYLDRNMHVQIF